MQLLLITALVLATVSDEAISVSKKKHYKWSRKNLLCR